MPSKPRSSDPVRPAKSPGRYDRLYSPEAARAFLERFPPPAPVEEVLPVKAERDRDLEARVETLEGRLAVLEGDRTRLLEDLERILDAIDRSLSSRGSKRFRKALR